MKKQVAGIVLVSALGVGAVSTAVLTPAAAATVQQAASQRYTDIRDALKGLVSDKTLTQAQADKVAATLDKALPQHGPGRGGHGHLADAATVLGMTPEELRTALGGTKSLARVAQSKGMSKATLIDKLVAAGEKRLAEAVTAGRMTQAEADAKKADLKAHITELVDRVGPPAGRGGPGGPGGRGHGGPPPAGEAPTTQPSST